MRTRVAHYLGIALLVAAWTSTASSPSALAAQAGRPVFLDLEAFSSDNVTVGAGDKVTVLVTAIYNGGGGSAIPCGDLNLGVMNDANAAFRDDAAGPWPASAWRNPQRVAATGCDGEVIAGTRVYWSVDLSIPRGTDPGVHPVGTFSPVWDGVGWSAEQIALSVTVTGPAGVADTPRAERPVFTPLEASGGDNVTVIAGDRATVAVAATLQDPGGAGEAIPCGDLNLGVVDDATANFRDDAEGDWEVHGWRNPSRVAASECAGEIRAGQRVEWSVRLYVPEGTTPGAHLVGRFSPVWDGVGWSAEQIRLTVTVTEPAPLVAASATAVTEVVGLTPETVEPLASPGAEVVPTGTAAATGDLPEPTPAATDGSGWLVVLVTDEATQPLPGNTCFDVYTDAGDGAWGSLSADGCDETDGSDGMVTIEGLLAGDYVVTQNTPPDGYAWAADQRISILSGEELRITVVQPPLETATEAIATGETGNPGAQPDKPDPTAEVPEPEAASTLPPEYAGTWEGDAVQVNPADEFPVTIAVAGGVIDEVVASIEYPSYDCVGDLRLDRITPESIQLTEFITVGADVCIDGGAMTLTLNSDGTMDFSWNAPEGSTTAGATLFPVTDITDATSAAGIEPTPAVTEEPTETPVASEPTETPVSPQPTETPVAPTEVGAAEEETPIAESPSITLPPEFSGTWAGQGVQTNPDVEWPVTLTFSGGSVGEVVASSDYPSYGCGGELTLDRVEPDRRRIVLRERITVGEDRCNDGGVMTLYFEADGSLIFNWSSADGSTTARAELRNTDGGVVFAEPTAVDPEVATETIDPLPTDTPVGDENFPPPTETPTPDRLEPVDDSDDAATDPDAAVIEPIGGSEPIASSDPTEVSGGAYAPQPAIDEPNAADEPVDAAAQAATDAAVRISRLEAARDFDALYDAMHPDAQARIPREVIVGWYEDYLATQTAGELTVTDVRFVEWTWGVTGTTYPSTAEIEYVQPFVENGAETEVADALRLVEHDGEWRWFFGQTAEFVDEQIEQYAAGAVSEAGGAGTNDVLFGADTEMHDVARSNRAGSSFGSNVFGKPATTVPSYVPGCCAATALAGRRSAR